MLLVILTVGGEVGVGLELGAEGESRELLGQLQDLGSGMERECQPWITYAHHKVYLTLGHGEEERGKGRERE